MVSVPPRRSQGYLLGTVKAPNTRASMPRERRPLRRGEIIGEVVGPKPASEADYFPTVPSLRRLGRHPRPCGGVRARRPPPAPGAGSSAVDDRVAQSISSLRPRKTGNLGTPSTDRLWYLNLTVAPIHSDRAAQMRARVTSSKPVPISNLTRVPRGSHDEIDHTAIHTQGCTRRG